MAQQASSASRVPVHIEASGKPVLLDPAVEHDILMVAREAVYNAVKHAQPNQVYVKVEFDDASIRMSVLDDGCGFDPDDAATASAGEHFGLIGMRERTARLGGRFEIRSAPGAGTELSISVPVRSHVAQKLGMDLRS
jgi:signal transduction histidine kinase